MARWCFYCCHVGKRPSGPPDTSNCIVSRQVSHWFKIWGLLSLHFLEGKRLSSVTSRGSSDHLVKQLVKEEHGKMLKHALHTSYYYSFCQERAGTGTTAIASLLFSQSVISSSLCPHGLKPTRLLCALDSPSKNTGVGCRFSFQGFFLTQGSKLHLLHWRGSLLVSHQVCGFLRSVSKIYLWVFKKNFGTWWQLVWDCLGLSTISKTK